MEGSPLLLEHRQGICILTFKKIRKICNYIMKKKIPEQELNLKIFEQKHRVLLIP
jgi:hypothetical protein